MAEKYESEREYKITQLQNKINNLNSENTILKDLIEDLRSKLLEKQQSRMS
jgi:cell division protein FtsB